MDLEKRPEQPAPQTDLRASDADRDRTADILREALAEGRLTAEEHAERIDGVYRAKTHAELEPLVRDLPGAHTQRRPAVSSPAPNRPTMGAVPAVADENLVAVFSTSTRKGRWRVGRRTHAYAVFGNIEIDLSEAIFEYQQVVIKAVSVFGNVEVRVPENTRCAAAAAASSATSRWTPSTRPTRTRPWSTSTASRSSATSRPSPSAASACAICTTACANTSTADPPPGRCTHGTVAAARGRGNSRPSELSA